MTSNRIPEVDSSRNVSVESFPCLVEDRYYLRRMKEILQDGLPRSNPPTNHDQISGHVYIGNQRNADDASGLRSEGIDHVLSCAASRRSSESPYEPDSGIVGYFLIPAEDREDFDIMRYFEAAFLFLDRVKRRQGKALVHCNMGVNRSGAIVAAYLMVDEQKTLLDVVTYLKQKRNLILSNKGFRRQLVQFARTRGLLDPVVDTVTSISYMDTERRRERNEERKEETRKAEVGLPRIKATEPEVDLHRSKADETATGVNQKKTDLPKVGQGRTRAGEPDVGLNRTRAGEPEVGLNGFRAPEAEVDRNRTRTRVQEINPSRTKSETPEVGLNGIGAGETEVGRSRTRAGELETSLDRNKPEAPEVGRNRTRAEVVLNRAKTGEPEVGMRRNNAPAPEEISLQNKTGEPEVNFIRAKTAEPEVDLSRTKRSTVEVGLLQNTAVEKGPFRQFVRFFDEGLRRGNAVADGKESEKNTQQRKEKEISFKLRDNVIANGDVSATIPTPIDFLFRKMSRPKDIQLARSDADVPVRKYSSSVQYWPVVSTPRDVNKDFTVRETPDTQPPPPAPAGSKRRRYVRARSDYRPGSETAAEFDNDPADKPSTAAAPPRVQSTIYCTLRLKPKKNQESVKRDEATDGVRNLHIKDHELLATHPVVVNRPSPVLRESSSFDREDASVPVRARCFSGTAVDRPSSVVGADTEFNGFLVLLGKKVVHSTRSASQWNLATRNRESDSYFLTESRQSHAAVARSRSNFSEAASGATGGPAWRSFEKISESKNVAILRQYAL